MDKTRLPLGCILPKTPKMPSSTDLPDRRCFLSRTCSMAAVGSVFSNLNQAVANPEDLEKLTKDKNKIVPCAVRYPRRTLARMKSIRTSNRRPSAKARQFFQARGAMKGIAVTTDLWPKKSTIHYDFVPGEGIDRYRKLVETGMRQWEAFCGLTFERATGVPDVRIGFDASEGHYSYVGKACREVLRRQEDDRTMNLNPDDFDATTRTLRLSTILHELGHTIGLHHEHKNGNFDWDFEVLQRFLAGWTPEEIVQNVTQELKGPTVQKTDKYDRDSIMSYWFPSNAVKSGTTRPPTSPNTSISKTDQQFVADLYDHTITSFRPGETSRDADDGTRSRLNTEDAETLKVGTEITKSFSGIGELHLFRINATNKAHLTTNSNSIDVTLERFSGGPFTAKPLAESSLGKGKALLAASLELPAGESFVVVRATHRRITGKYTLKAGNGALSESWSRDIKDKQDVQQRIRDRHAKIEELQRQLLGQSVN